MISIKKEDFENANEKYLYLLSLYGTNLNDTKNSLQTTSKWSNIVTIDILHDAIVYIGVDMSEPIGHYRIKAKHFALNSLRNCKTQSRILKENMAKLIGDGFNFEKIQDYDFTEKELYIIMQKLNGFYQKDLKISRRKYKTIIKNIENKIKATL
jgi:hypothetical protein